MNTYNFEQAMQGLAHGIPVAREWWEKNQDGQIFCDEWDLVNYGVDLDDVFATDWVDAS